MPKGKGDSEITVPTYQKHLVEVVENGHNITIYSNTGTITIKCRYPKPEASGEGHEKG